MVRIACLYLTRSHRNRTKSEGETASQFGAVAQSEQEVPAWPKCSYHVACVRPFLFKENAQGSAVWSCEVVRLQSPTGCSTNRQMADAANQQRTHAAACLAGVHLCV